MGDADGVLRVAVGGKDVFVDGAVGADGVDDGCGVLLAVRGGSDEAGVSAASDGAAEMAFVDAAGFGGPDRGEVIFGVEDGVAEDEVGFAMEDRRSGFGDDLDASAAGTVELGGVGVVVDADLLNGRGGDAGGLHLDAVDDDGGAAGGA